MCEFCTKHGEGKKWYLNAKNYGDDLLSDAKRRTHAINFFSWANKTYKLSFGILNMLPTRIPIIGIPVRAIVKKIFVNEHWGQVIPIEDIDKILSLASSIVRIPCICRKITTGKERRTCFLLSLNPSKLGMADIIDQSFFGGPDVARFENVTKDIALAFFRLQEPAGLIHSIWTIKTPFAAALCNCDSSGCIAIKSYRKRTPVFFRAEYVAAVDADKCVGCKACSKLCQFAAIGYDLKGNKARINPKKCYGCGICRVTCKKNAITLHDRRVVAGVANLW